LALFVAAISLLLSTGPPGDLLDASAANALAGAQASTSGSQAVSIPVLRVDSSADGTNALTRSQTVPAAGATPSVQAAAGAAPAGDTTPSVQPAPRMAAAADTTSSEQPDPAPTPSPSPAPTPSPAPAADPPQGSDARSASKDGAGEPAVGSIKSKADEKGYDVHGHVEHSVALLGQQVLIPGQAATGGFIQTGDNSYLAYSPVTAMLPVAIQDNKEVLAKKPNLQGEKLYRRLAQEYTGSNDYKNLDRDARRAINILTCTDWSLVDKRVRENTINHLLHSPISFGTIGSVDNPISTDVTIDLGYTHTRDTNWTEVEYMGNNVYKVTVVSNNNNGSHTGHEMGTAYVEMPAGTTLREAQKIGNRMIPSTNKNNKLTIDPAARDLFEALPRGASPMILFEHLSEADQDAYFKGRGVETVGKPNPDCNPLEGGILGSTPAPADPAPEQAPAEDQAPPADGTPAEDQAPPADGTPAEDQTPPTDGTPAEDQTPPADGTPEGTTAGTAAETPAVEPEATPPADDPATPEPSSDSG
jgi:hypothetical protein